MPEPTISPADPPAGVTPSPLLTAEENPAERIDGRVELNGRSLREHAARGTIINTGFLVGVSTLGLVRGFIVAAFLTRADYGIWGILVVGMGTLVWLKEVGISDKYIQQDEADQELAFQKAFTLEAIFSAAFFVLCLFVVPLLALIYHNNELLLPGFVCTLTVPAMVLQAPIWVYYRQMRYGRQRMLQSFEPVTAFVVTIALAVAGAGYWALIIGFLCGVWIGAIVAIRATPYKLAWRYDHGTARSYIHFSWPLFMASLGSLVVAQGSFLLGNVAVGLAGVGAIALAATIAQFAQRVDSIVTGTLYPAVCAVRDRVDLLFESFVKSNRLALMWGMPFGVGVALFTPDMVHYAIGDQWEPAILLIQAYGLTAAIDQLAFNWDAYFRARSDTRPIAVNNLIAAATFLVVAVPLLLIYGLDGFGIGMVAVAAAQVGSRCYFLKTRLFGQFNIAVHIGRAVAPTIPAVLVVLAVRMLEPTDRSLGVAVSELVIYLAVTVAATWFFERRLLREMVGYLRLRTAT